MGRDVSPIVDMEDKMSEHIDPTSASKPLQSMKHDELMQKRQREQSKLQGGDRVSLHQSEQPEATYGPQTGLNVGTPYEVLRSLVIKTLQDQNVPVMVSTGSGQIDMTEMTAEEAQELISEEGYFGVEKTSDRIVEFATNAFGNDPARLEEMKQAIGEGFKDAEEAFGGTLPEISQQTYDAIMQKLDAFAAQFEKAGE